jgi:adenine deaminase
MSGSSSTECLASVRITAMRESAVTALKERIRAARGEIRADLVLKGAKVIDVFAGEIHEGDVAVHRGFIVGLGSDYRGNQEVEVQGCYVSPGLIDGHIHIESTMLLPSRLAASLVLHGTTAIVSDPHEIANVMGVKGVELMLQDSRSMPFDVFFMAPSCVPATTLETSGATLGTVDLETLKKEPRILGLAEMMNFPGVITGAEHVLEKLNLFADRPMDGHAPFLRGKDLQAYVCAGIRSDHEVLDRNEALEKVSSGMMIMIREGSTARNLEELLPLVNPANSRRFCFVSDDLHPEDLLSRGHLEHILKKAVSRGLDPVVALQLVSLNPAEYFGLRDRGAVAPGYLADLVVFNNLEEFAVQKVYKRGALVVDGGNPVGFPPWEDAPSLSRPLLIHGLHPDRFRIRRQGEEARVIEIVRGQVVTKMRREKMASGGEWVAADPHRDILKLAVVERHIGSGRIGLGLVRGFGLKKGALATSVAHDSHNVIAVGVTDEDLCRAVRGVKDMGGGMAVASGGELRAKTPLEVGGLMSKGSLESLTNQLRELAKASAELGCTLEAPFMVLSFLALPVIPELKLTDLGLVDVNRFEVVPLFF